MVTGVFGEGSRLRSNGDGQKLKGRRSVASLHFRVVAGLVTWTGFKSSLPKPNLQLQISLDALKHAKKERYLFSIYFLRHNVAKYISSLFLEKPQNHLPGRMIQREEKKKEPICSNFPSRLMYPQKQIQKRNKPR